MVQKLKAGLKARGFEPSKVDPCLFLGKKGMVVSCVDNVLIAFKRKKDIDEFLQSFKDDGDEFNWEHTPGTDINKFLGIKIDATEEGGFMFSQPALIEKVLGACNMLKCNKKDTPTNTTSPLGTDAQGAPATGRFNFA